MKSSKVLLLVLSFFILASCKEKPNTVLIAGDSWGFLVCYHGSLERALERAGVLDVKTNTACEVTTLLGARASNWAGTNFHKAVRANLLDATVKAVYISLGGNDVIAGWNRTMTLDQEAELFLKVKADLQQVIDVYRKARPDVKILISGYDFPRFTLNHIVPSHRQLHEQMGSPTPQELNEALVRFSTVMSEIADQKQVFYIHHLGLMHYYYGNYEASLRPGQTLAPELISSPDNVMSVGGDVHLMSDADAMGTIVNYGPGVKDTFHLSKAGYEKLADHAVMHYLKSWFTSPSASAQKK